MLSRIRLSDLANNNMVCIVKFEFKINSEYLFEICGATYTKIMLIIFLKANLSQSPSFYLITPFKREEVKKDRVREEAKQRFGWLDCCFSLMLWGALILWQVCIMLWSLSHIALAFCTSITQSLAKAVRDGSRMVEETSHYDRAILQRRGSFV